MKSPYFYFFLLFCFSCSQAPPPSWTNYPVASNFQELSKLPKSIHESSGLVYWKEGLWTLNDSGNAPHLLQVGIYKKEKRRELKVKDVANIDWESLAQDSAYFYIGDFGNNKGIRKNLVIHLLDKKTLLVPNGKIPIAGSIAFKYQDQEIPALPQRNHNFNCEAMIVGADSIFLFTKNHADQQTQIYRLPKTPGSHIAIPGKKFQSDGLITGADWDAAQGILALVGYNADSRGHHPFVWFFSDYSGTDFFGGKAQRLNLPVHLQVEGIAHFKERQFFLTNETEGGKKGRIFLLDLQKE